MVSRNVIEVNEEKPLFQLFFLKDDEDRSVEIEEVEEVDFREVERRLKPGESVFITCKREQELNTSLAAREDAAEPWYFSHIQGSARQARMNGSLVITVFIGFITILVIGG